MEKLHELLSERRDEIIRRWAAQVRGTLHPDSMPSMELIDHLPVFLDQIREALQRKVSLEASAIASEHGVQRLALGFSLGSVVREYGAMHECILGLAREHDVILTLRETQVLFECVITGIAEAVSEYARQRDAEVQRHATEHFAFIAHELRNPLQSVKGALDLLKAKGELPENSRYVSVVERGFGRMHDLIESSLSVARIGIGIALRREPMSLAHVFDEVALMTSLSAESKGVRLEFQADSADEIPIDRRLVRSALSNLVSNAIKFTEPGGGVKVRGSIDASHATIEVEDECGGLPPGEVEKAFAPFVQLSGSTDGFGLGLAIAKQAADAHGGSLRVQNLPGRGCIFILELPMSAPTAAA